MKTDRTLIFDAFWVDNKPFPTEESIESETGQAFFDGYVGDATHFGWMDMIQLKNIIRKNRISHIILKNLDVLGRAAMIAGCVKVCTSYLYNHLYIIKTLPEHNDLENCEPIYNEAECDGWDFTEDDTEIPFRAQCYMMYLLYHTKVKSVICSSNKVRFSAYFDENGNVQLHKESIS